MRHWLAASAFTFSLCASAQGEGHTIKGSFDLFTTDDLGHLYALEGDKLSLYDAKGERIARNSLNTFGPITRIDAFSSLKPLIFSRQQGTLALLDNTLSVQGSPIDLPRNGFTQVTEVCMSVRNSFWFFDERELSLLRVDAQLRPLANSGRLDQLLGITPHPTYMTEYDSWLYVCDPEIGVLVFDLFGSFSRTLPIQGAQTVEVRDGAILFVKDGVFMRYDLLTMEITPLVWPEAVARLRVKQARVERGQLSMLTDEGIVVDELR
ncbi:MAG TPA: hypothetical protein VGE21_01570 [Flavobacteriales bacterium]